MKTYIKFYNGNQMPIIGYGMWQSEKANELEKALNNALDAGYRHFDTAFRYTNEGIFGRVIKEWLQSGKVKREELFIVTKLPPQGNHHDRVQKFLCHQLKDLQLDYVDLYLVHNPAPLKNDPNNWLNVAFNPDGSIIPDDSTTIEKVWKAMEDQVTSGRAKSIGISNYSIQQIERILKIATIKPANHQIELNASYPREAMRKFCSKHEIVVSAFAPLGSPGRKEYYKAARGANVADAVQIPKLLNNPIVIETSKKHSKTPAQILLRFLAQQDIVVLPKSVTPSRIKENFDIFNFELDSTDIDKLNCIKINDDGTWGFDWLCALPGLDKHPQFQLSFGK